MDDSGGRRLVLHTFWRACEEKFHVKGKGDNRSERPWEDFDQEWLMVRLSDEWLELVDSIKITTDGIQITNPEEFIDVALLCAFNWLKGQ